MKVTSLLAIVALAPLVSSTVTFTKTRCSTSLAKTKGPVHRTTQYSTRTVHKTCTHTITPVTTVTPAPNTVTVTATTSTTFTNLLAAEVDTVTTTTTLYETVTDTATETTASTTTTTAETNTVTQTETQPAPPGFTPLTPPASRRRLDGIGAAQPVAKRQPGAEQQQQQPESRDLTGSEVEVVEERDADLSHLLTRHQRQGELKCPAKRYPAKVSCKITKTKKIKTIKNVPAKNTITRTAAPKTVTDTTTTTVSTTTTIVPLEITLLETASTTSTLTTQTTTTSTTTVTETPPPVTTTETVYEKVGCDSTNRLSLQVESAYLGAVTNTEDSYAADYKACCFQCFDNEWKEFYRLPFTAVVKQTGKLPDQL